MTDMEQKILKEFFRQLMDVGYEATSLKSICRALDISTGHLSYYFPKKEMLLDMMNRMAIRKYSRILKEQLDFIEENSLQFCLLIEYYTFFITCRVESVKRSYLSMQKIPATIVNQSEALNEKYLGIFTAMGLPVDRNTLRIAHANMYFVHANTSRMKQDGYVDLSDEDIFIIGLRNFMWMCGMKSDEAEKYIDQLYKMVSMLDEKAIYDRAFQMEEMDYDEI